MLFVGLYFTMDFFYIYHTKCYHIESISILSLFQLHKVHKVLRFVPF